MAVVEHLAQRSCQDRVAIENNLTHETEAAVRRDGGGEDRSFAEEDVALAVG